MRNGRGYDPRHVSIYEHILKSIRKDRPGLPPEGLAIPGVAAVALGSPFAPGAREHLALYRGQAGPVPSDGDAKRKAKIDAIEAAARAAAASREPSDEDVQGLEAALDLPDTLSVVDEVMDRVGALGLEDWEPVFDALSAVALMTDKPQALKLSMALLGPFQEAQTIPFYRTLARHPEFSLYATTALANDPSPASRVALIQLLDETVGWAKVDVVERLLRVDDLDLGEVLLTKGMDAVDPVGGFIAIGIADRCDLAGALEAKGLTRDTLSGACRVLAQLARDAVDRPAGVPGTLDDYAEADDAVDAFRSRLPAGPADLDMAETAAAVAAWAEARGREDAAEDARAYLERADVVGAVIMDLTQNRDPARRAQAATLAGRAGIEDAAGTLLELLEEHPEDDVIAIAATRLARGADLVRLRDGLVARVKPESRIGEPSAHHHLDAGARWIWQWTALVEVLPRIPDETSRALLRTAAKDRDPSVRRAAFRSLRLLESDDPRDQQALSAAATDPAEEISSEATGAIPPPRSSAPRPKRPAPKPAKPISGKPGSGSGKRPPPRKKK